MSVVRLGDQQGINGSRDEYTPLVKIYTDASCARNGSMDSSAGCGAVLLDQNRLEIKLVANYLGNVTSQQAEVLACATALERLRRCCRVEVISDSKYVIDTMTGRNRMRSNRLLWTRLIEACYSHHVTWRWVKGHSGVLFRDVADRMARAVRLIHADISIEDLELLQGCLSNGSEQFQIGHFEAELEKVISKYEAEQRSSIPPSQFDGLGTLPSAFSA